MSTKQENIDDVNSCWNQAIDKEPIFILRSSDPLAPGLVRDWAAQYKSVKQDNSEYGAEQRKKYIEALKAAEDMEAYYND